MKICSVIGARPQFIKAAVVSRALRASAGASETLIHTGQHYDDNMSSVFFEEIEIPEPNYNLAVQGGSHGAQTGRMLEGSERVLVDEKRDCAGLWRRQLAPRGRARCGQTVHPRRALRQRRDV